MSVLIKGMKMPETCEKCKLESFCNLWVEARELCGWTPENRGVAIRHPNCPLIEVPPGRLINTDALMKSLHDEFDDDEVKAFEKGAYWNHNIVVDIIANTPTIIPAEEE